MAKRLGDDPKDNRPPLTIDLTPHGRPPSPGDALPDGLAMPAAAAAIGGVLGLTLSLIFAGLGVWPSQPTGNAAGGEIDKLRSELALARGETDKLAQRLNGLPAPSSDAVPAPSDAGVALAALTERVAAQEAALAALKAPNASPASAAVPALVEPRLEQFGADLAALRQAVAPVAALTERLTKLEAGLADARAAAEAARSLPQAVTALDGRFGRLEGTTAELQRQTAAIEARLSDASARVAGATTARTDAVLALTLANLKTAVDSGRPFATEMAVAASVVPGDSLKPLEPFSVSGVVSVARLADRFPALARRIGEAEQAKKVAGGSFVDRLMAQAQQSVTIRPVGETAASGLAGQLARIEAALHAGNAAAALTDWQGLPEAARALDATFAADLAARARVDALLSTTTRTALDRLAGRAP